MKLWRSQVKFTNWICYNGSRKPTESISDARWAAMVKHIVREFLAVYDN